MICIFFEENIILIIVDYLYTLFLYITSPLNKKHTLIIVYL